MKTELKCSVAGIAASVASFALAPNATGQELGVERLSLIEEIVVTARKRTESIQDVPISITAVSGQALRNAQVDALNELHRMVPNLVLTEGQGGSNATLSLRGVGTLIQEDPQGVESSIGTVVDGVVMGATAGLGITNFSDIERVEVLRGPQGTLFGKNSSGGLIHIITKDPTPEFSGAFGADYSPTYNQTQVDAVISGPLSGDSVLGRLSLFTSKRDGFIKNIRDGRMIGNDDQIGVRGKLLFMPSDVTSLKLTGSFVNREQSDSFEAGLTREIIDGGFILEELHNSDLASKTNDRTRGIGRTDYEDEIASVSLEWEQSLGEFSLTSITAYSSWNFDFNPEDQIPHQNVPVPWVRSDTQSVDQRQWSQELRLASPTGNRIDYVAGVYAFDESIGRTLDALLDAEFIGIPGLFGVRGSDDEIDTFNYAFFGEASFHATDQLTFIAGGRWTREEKEIDHRVPPLSAPGGAPFFIFGPTGLPDQTDEVTESEFTWRLGAQWEPSDDHMLYGTVATGFKGPTFNANASTELPGNFLRVGPETSTNYEIGWKGGLWDDRVRASLAVFHTVFEDFQAEVVETVVDEETGEESGVRLVRNASELETSGVEFELQALLAENLLFNFNTAYTDAKYSDFANAPCFQGQTAAEGCFDGVQDLSGTTLPRSSEWSFNTNAQYDVRTAMAFDGFVRLEYSWRDEIQWSLVGGPNTTEDAVGLIGASVGIRDKDGKYSMSLYGKNLTDEFHTNGIDGAGSNHVLSLYYQRIWGLSFDYAF